MKHYTLDAKPREITGRKVKKLRKIGLIPVSIYGKNIKSASFAVVRKEFEKVYGEAGGTGLIEIQGSGADRHVLVHDVQIHPVSAEILHVEFFQVDLNEKVRANVPLELTGESQAVSDKIGVILTLVDEVSVEALPAKLPEKLSVDVSVLHDIGQEISVSDLLVPLDVTVLADAHLVLVRLGALVSKEAQAEAQAEKDVAKDEAMTPEKEGDVTKPESQEPEETKQAEKSE
ncbi:MAG: 50S ribosomal protein L25 [bacterium]|nr:50S ribosomal protein L25 [bacterium]